MSLWSEIDRDSATWTIPGDRMKGGKEHRVPLSRGALAVLDEAEQLRDGSDLVFPSVTKPGHRYDTRQSDEGLAKDRNRERCHGPRIPNGVQSVGGRADGHSAGGP